MTAILLFVFFLTGGIFGMLVTALVTYNSTDNIDWISVADDLPCNHKELINHSSSYPTTVEIIVKYQNGKVCSSYMYELNNGKWEWHIILDEDTFVVSWMPLPK